MCFYLTIIQDREVEFAELLHGGDVRCRCWPRAAAGRTCAGVSARDPSLTTNNAELNAQLLFFISQCLSYLIVYIVTFKYLLTTYRAR